MSFGEKYVNRSNEGWKIYGEKKHSRLQRILISLGGENEKNEVLVNFSPLYEIENETPNDSPNNNPNENPNAINGVKFPYQDIYPEKKEEEILNTYILYKNLFY